ncbi:g11142 [Coccomyxa elongata]
MPVYDVSMQRVRRGQNRLAKELASKARDLAASKFAEPLHHWAVAPTQSQGVPEPVAGAQQYHPGHFSTAGVMQPGSFGPSASSMPHYQPAMMAPFPPLPSQQEFAAALAPRPPYAAASEPYDPLWHGPVSQPYTSMGRPPFQFAAGAAQSVPPMQPQRQPHAVMPGIPPAALSAQHVQAVVSCQSAEQAAEQFLQSMGEQPDMQAPQSLQGPPTNGAKQPTQHSEATPGQSTSDGQQVTGAATSGQSTGAITLDAKSQALAEVIVWRRGQWVGPSPREHLLEWSVKHTLPRPCYDVMQRHEAPSLFQATCILPHLALQITPVAAFPAPEDAEQNAALMAIVYIEGGLAEDCTLCTLTRVGQAALPGWTPVQVNSPALPSHAQLVKVLEERMDALRTRQEMLDQEFEVRRSALGKEQNLLKLQQEALLQGGLNAHTIAATLLKELNDPGGTDDGPALKKQKVQAPQVKGPVQELKEFCEKHKWRLPSYEFSSGREGRGYVCRLTLPDANISGMQSGLQPNQKAAKAEVSVDGLKVAHMFAAQQELS